MREFIKPAIEILAGFPSVVIGFFALIVMATVLQGIFGYESRLNAFVAGLALALAVIFGAFGAHALRAGVDFLYNDVTITYPRSNRGAYTFSSLANFLSGTWAYRPMWPKIRCFAWQRAPASF